MPDEVCYVLTGIQYRLSIQFVMPVVFEVENGDFHIIFNLSSIFQFRCTFMNGGISISLPFSTSLLSREIGDIRMVQSQIMVVKLSLLELVGTIGGYFP